MKRVEYISPIDCLRGSVSQVQTDLDYDGGDAYAMPVGSRTSAGNYLPILVAKLAQRGRNVPLRYFQVRGRSTVNMTAANKHNLALMGGVGALIGRLLSDKTAPIYIACASLVPTKKTFRSFLAPILRSGLDRKLSNIVIANGVSIVNPWISTATPNVPVSQEVLTKFSSELS